CSSDLAEDAVLPLVHGGGVQGDVEVLVHGGGVQGDVEVLVHGGGEVLPEQPVWAGFVRPIPWLRSHSYPALWSDPFGYWPLGFLLSALPTQPAHGFPTALPLPLPLPDGEPLRVEQYGPPGHFPFAPPEFESAREIGCGWLNVPLVPALPCECVPALPCACFPALLCECVPALPCGCVVACPEGAVACAGGAVACPGGAVACPGGPACWLPA